MPTRLTGIPALSYMGVEAPQPPNITFHPRAPLQSDYQNFNTGDLWVDTSNFPPNPPTAENIWMLVSKQNRVGIWVNFSGQAGDLDSLTGDTGGPVFGDANQNINILSGILGLTVDGNPATNTLTLNASEGGNLFQGLAADDSPPNVFPDANGIINIEGTVGNITTSQDAVNNSIIINTGGGVALEYTTDDANSAEPFNRNLNVFGGNGIITSTPVPGGDTININSVTGSVYFTARLSGNINMATGTALAPVILDTVVAQIGTAYDNSTGLFTAPASGIYQFNGTLTFATIDPSITSFGSFFGVAGTGPFAGTTWSMTRTNDVPGVFTVWRFSGAITMQLDAGDTVYLYASLDGGTGTANINPGLNGNSTLFSGFRIS